MTTFETDGNTTEMGAWMEAGGMREVPLQPGEADWVGWHIGQGPRSEAQVATFGVAGATGRLK